MRLHGRWLLTERTHSGIILTSQENFGIGELQRRLTRIATSLEPTDMVDRVEFLNAWG